MSLQHEESDGHSRVTTVKQGVIPCDQFVWSEAIAFGLGHFSAIDRQHVSMHPIVDGALASVCANILRDFTFVVRKFQIHAATMNVKGFSQVLGAHDRAFQMPSREPFTPR